MKISLKMNLLSGFLLSGFLFLLIFSVYSISTIISSMTELNAVYSHLNKIRQCENLLVSQLAESQQIILRDTGSVDGDLLIGLRLKNSQLTKAIQQLENTKLPESIKMNTGITEGFKKLYSTIDTRLIQKIFNQEGFNTSEVSELIFSEYNNLQNEINIYQKETEAGLEEITNANRLARRNLILIFLVLFMLIAASLVAMLIFMRRSVLRPVQETSKEMLNLAEGRGNLEFRFSTDRNDEIGELNLRFNSFIEKTAALVSKIGEAGRLSEVLGARLEEDILLNSSLSENLKLSIKEFTDYFTDLSGYILEIEQFTTNIFKLSNQSKKIISDQKIILETASGSIIETIDEIKLLRSNGRSSLDASEELMTSAGQGADVINELDRQIEEILNSANNLSLINKVLSDISDRTKILGINAAIEAARAGSYGSGFKIVSSEIAALGDEVMGSAVKTEKNLNMVLESISRLKDKSENSKGIFETIKDNSADMMTGISTIMDKLKKHEKHEKKLVDNISELSTSSRNVSDFILELDSGITDIFESVKLLDKNLNPVRKKITTASNDAEELNSMRKRLEQTAGENHSVAETLNNYIEHFEPDIY